MPSPSIAKKKTRPYPRVITPGSPKGSTGAKQSFKDECDINLIMARYQRTGAIDHVTKHQPNYGYATSMEFTEAMQTVAYGQTMFNELPSTIRTKFDNDAAQFLDYVQDPANEDQLADLGLEKAKQETETAKPASEAPKEPAAPFTPDPKGEATKEA